MSGIEDFERDLDRAADLGQPHEGKPVEVDVDKAIAELERELIMRRRLYPTWINQGRLKLLEAQHQVRRLAYAIRLLKEWRALSPMTLWYSGNGAAGDHLTAIVCQPKREDGLARRLIFERVEPPAPDMQRPWLEEKGADDAGTD